MIKNKAFIWLVMALPMVLLSSCLKDQEDIFDEASSLRLQKALDEVHSALTKAEHGWVLDYFPHSSQAYGGYIMTLKFDDKQVTAMSEIDNEAVETTNYTIKNDFGPVLSFDTYNSIIHYFSTPSGSSSTYQAMGGDFEFVVDSVGADRIKIHGKRSQNTMYLRKLTEPAADYLKKADAQWFAFIYGEGSATVGGKDVAWEFDLDRKRAYYSYEDNGQTVEGNVAYCFTNTGIRLFEPVKIGGKEIRTFIFDDHNQTLTCTDEGATDVVAQLVLPEGYTKYGDLAGDHILTFETYANSEWTTQTPRITLEPTADRTGFWIRGLNENLDIKISYNRSKGIMTLYGGQRIATLPNGNYVGFISADADDGYINYGSTIGMVAKWSEKDGCFLWEDTKVWQTHKVSSFYLYEFKSTSFSTANRVGALTDTDYMIAGTARMYYLKSMKKVE